MTPKQISSANRWLSRAEVNRRLTTLAVDSFKDLSGEIGGCRVWAWATQKNRRIERVSISAKHGSSNPAPAALRVAKQIFCSTGLIVHFHGGGLNGQIGTDGRILVPRQTYTLPLP